MVTYTVGDTVTYGHPDRHVTHQNKVGKEAIVISVKPDGASQHIVIQFDDGFVWNTWNTFVELLVRNGPW